MHEEGRIRPNSINKSDTMFYDFFEKDHLGNTRVVLTDEKPQDVYPAAYGREQCQLDDMLKNYYSIQYGRYHQYIQDCQLGSDREQELCQQQWQSALQYRSVFTTTATSNIVYN